MTGAFNVVNMFGSSGRYSLIVYIINAWTKAITNELIPILSTNLCTFFPTSPIPIQCGLSVSSVKESNCATKASSLLLSEGLIKNPEHHWQGWWSPWLSMLMIFHIAAITCFASLGSDGLSPTSVIELGKLLNFDSHWCSCNDDIVLLFVVWTSHHPQLLLMFLSLHLAKLKDFCPLWWACKVLDMPNAHFDNDSTPRKPVLTTHFEKNTFLIHFHPLGV